MPTKTEQTETISPIDYAYRVRSKTRKALEQAQEAGMPKDLIRALSAALAAAQKHLDSLTDTDGEAQEDEKPAPKPSEDRKALIEEINALKRANASLKAEETLAERVAPTVRKPNVTVVNAR